MIETMLSWNVNPDNSLFNINWNLLNNKKNKKNAPSFTNKLIIFPSNLFSNKNFEFPDYKWQNGSVAKIFSVKREFDSNCATNAIFLSNILNIFCFISVKVKIAALYLRMPHLTYMSKIFFCMSMIKSIKFSCVWGPSIDIWLEFVYCSDA